VKAKSSYTSLWGTLHRQEIITLSPTSEHTSTLPPITSHLEGVGNYYAACAATIMVATRFYPGAQENLSAFPSKPFGFNEGRH